MPKPHLKMADPPDLPASSPARTYLAECITRRTELVARVAAIETAARTARNDVYTAQSDLAKWAEYLPSAIELEASNRVNEALGQPPVPLEKTPAEARAAMATLEDEVGTAKEAKRILEDQLQRAQADLGSANSRVTEAVREVVRTDEATRTLLLGLGHAIKTHFELWNACEALGVMMVPEDLKDCRIIPAEKDIDPTLRQAWAAAIKAIESDAAAPLPS